MTQNAGYLAPTLNAGLAAAVPALPAQSLDGQIDTFSGGIKVSAAPLEGLRMNVSYDRNVRDNQTSRLAYPRVVTDMFLPPDTRTNTPFDFTQDLFKLTADYRATDEIKLSGGAEYDMLDRNYQEVVSSHETTIWGRMGIQATDEVALSLKLALADRDHSTYGVATWYGYAENPLLRRYNLAARQRQSAAVRADIVLGDGVNLGLDVDVAIDDYDETQVGLTYGRNSGIGADLSAAITEALQLQAYWRSDWVYSRQAGSEQAAQPDWRAYSNDDTNMIGFGLRWAAIEDKLDLGADLVFTRARSDIEMDTAAGRSLFPEAKTSMDTYKLFGTYRLRDNLSVTASVWYERYRSTDWRLDGVMPATVPSLLSYGVQPPDYGVSVVLLALRYGF
jgi:MtrB/PioB family decaheme-associated outer membrane protein